jgi:hypothetical protein
MPSAESDPAAGSAVPPAEGATMKEVLLADPMNALPEAIDRWVKTPCGRAKYLELAQRRGPLARLRCWWFVGIAALRDWRLPAPDRH